MKQLLLMLSAGCMLILTSFTKDANNLPAVAETSSSVVAITVYSGNCTLYKRTLVEGNKRKYTSLGTAFGKVVIDHSAKRFSFYFNGKLVFSQTNYLSHNDGHQGGEGFSFDGDYSAHRFTAERTFNIYDQAGSFGSGGSFLGYEYEITNYKIN
jgi:hypothetical protein